MDDGRVRSGHVPLRDSVFRRGDGQGSGTAGINGSHATDRGRHDCQLGSGDEDSALDPIAREVILKIEAAYDALLQSTSEVVLHLPSRVRSLLWILAATPVLEQYGHLGLSRETVVRALADRLPPAAVPALRPASHVQIRRVV